MYHRFGEKDYPSTNIRIEQLEAHIAELGKSKYSVLPLGEILDHLEQGTALPDRSVAITIDDAYLSVYTEAWPRLKKAGLPFTVFVSTQAVDAKLKNYMSWDQIRELKADGITIGHHTVSHSHMAALPADRLMREVEDASKRYQDELGMVPDIFAYPYGEYGTEVQRIVAKAGFRAAFGQQSGVLYSGADRFALPRFAMSENYGGLGRFQLAVNALPLRVTDVLPLDNKLSQNPPNFGFTVDEDIENLEQLSCFASNQSGGATPLHRLGPTRFEVRLSKPFRPGRGRINCTVPAKDKRWRWFGSQFYITKE